MTKHASPDWSRLLPVRYGVTLFVLGMIASGTSLTVGPGEKVGEGQVWRRTFDGPATDEGWGVDIAGAGDTLVADTRSIWRP